MIGPQFNQEDRVFKPPLSLSFTLSSTSSPSSSTQLSCTTAATFFSYSRRFSLYRRAASLLAGLFTLGSCSNDWNIVKYLRLQCSPTQPLETWHIKKNSWDCLEDGVVVYTPDLQSQSIWFASNSGLWFTNLSRLCTQNDGRWTLWNETYVSVKVDLNQHESAFLQLSPIYNSRTS